MGSGRLTALIIGTIGILESSLGFVPPRPLSIALKCSYHCRRQRFGFTPNKRSESYLSSPNRLRLLRYCSTTNEGLFAFNSHKYKYVVYLAVGSNLGDRFQNIRKALQLLEVGGDVRLTQTSFLYETKPMYVTDQPAFLNGAVEIHTNLDPLRLLDNIKKVEAQLGRDFTTIRNGPRPVDLDILTYAEMANDKSAQKGIIMDTEALTIPHSRIQERDFVLVPFIDVAPRDFVLPTTNTTLYEALKLIQRTSGLAEPSATRVLPLPRGRMLYFNETIIMGILNVTPDSFSDGGQWTTSIDDAVNKAVGMENEGAAIIDIGGESTRPGAAETNVDEQIRRTIPVIEGIRKGMFVAGIWTVVFLNIVLMILL